MCSGVSVLQGAVELLRVLTFDLWLWLAVGSVLYFSWHRYEHGRFWPFLRESDADAVGRGQGLGFTVNLPWNQVPTLKPQVPTQPPSPWAPPLPHSSGCSLGCPARSGWETLTTWLPSCTCCFHWPLR